MPRLPAAAPAALVRIAPVVVLVGAALALLVAEFLELREVRAITAVPPGGTTTGGPHHGYALGVIALASLPMTLGVVRRGSRPAAAALVALGAAALAIFLAIDLPGAYDEGQLERTYELAEARPQVGFWVELGGAVALLAGGLLALRGRVTEAREHSTGRARERRVQRVTES